MNNNFSIKFAIILLRRIL